MMLGRGQHRCSAAAVERAGGTSVTGPLPAALPASDTGRAVYPDPTL